MFDRVTAMYCVTVALAAFLFHWMEEAVSFQFIPTPFNQDTFHSCSAVTLNGLEVGLRCWFGIGPKRMAEGGMGE